MKEFQKMPNSVTSVRFNSTVIFFKKKQFYLLINKNFIKNLNLIFFFCSKKKGELFAYGVSYDWSKGSEGVNSVIKYYFYFF